MYVCLYVYYFVEMLKFSNNTFFFGRNKNIFVRESEESFGNVQEYSILNMDPKP